MQMICKNRINKFFFGIGLLMFGLLFLVSACNNGDVVSKAELDKADSLSIRLNSPELKAINAELLKDPANPELYNQRCQLYIKYKQFKEAIGDANRAIKLDSTNAAYYTSLADVYFAQNETRQTKEILEKTVAKFPESTEALMKLSELYFIVKQYQKAIDHINSALKINENIARAYYLKGSIYRESTDTARAISSLETATEQDNTFIDAYYDLGIIYAARKNPLAFEYFNNVLRIDPNYNHALYARAKLLQDLDKYNEALEEYSKLLNLNPEYAEAHYNSGAIYLDVKKEYGKAADYFTQAIKHNNSWSAAYFARGYSRAKLGLKKEAADDYRKCLAIDPDFNAAIQGLNELK